MNTPIFSLAYTSVRPQCIAGVVALWDSCASARAEIEWVIAVDAGDEASLAAARSVQSRFPVKVVVNSGSKDCVSGWNAACAATSGKVIIAVADDFLPPSEWDTGLLDLSPEGWIDGEHAVHVEDGYVHNLMVLPIVTRQRYARFGYLYYPKYSSLFCDTELTEVAYRDGVVIAAKHLLFEHRHPDCGKRERDAVDREHASQERWNMGEMLFNYRRACGFPIDDGPRSIGIPTEAPKPVDTVFAVYMQVTQDDLCLMEVCERMMSEGCRDFFFSVPDTYWSGEPVPESVSATLLPVFERLRGAGARVEVQPVRIAKFRMLESDTRICVETRVRNASLAWIRRCGFEHILCVDGDELWKPGTLDMLRPIVAQGHTAISVRMIPVVGVPGYPVEGATDTAVVYVGPKCSFQSCRTPTGRPFHLDLPQIIHFTSTRRNNEENVAKHRRSGHYDDPDYDFEGWLTGVLPNAKPGLKNVHMFKPFQIWKELRKWRPEELAVIPESIWQYLGK